jgi:hypothetical protein
MADVYKVGVSILLNSNASGVLGLMAKQLLGIDSQIKNLASSWGRTSKIIGGAVGIVAGVGIIKGIADIAKHGEKLLDQQEKLIRAGRTQAQVASLTAEAYREITKAVPTATVSDVLRATNELTMVTGDFDKARAAVAQSLKSEALISSATGKGAEGQGYQLWRAAEMKGVSMDAAASDALFGKMVAGVIASGGKITGSEYRNFAQQAGSGWSNANDHALGGSIPYMINEVGGERAGTGWARMTNTIQATRRWTRQQYEAFKSLGLIDQENVLGGDLGGKLNFKPGASPIKGGMANLGDMADEIANVIRPAFLKAGITDPQMADSWLAKMFPDSVAAKFAQRLYRQADNIEKDRKNIDAAKPLNPAYNSLTANNPKGVRLAYEQQLESMLAAMGGPAMQAAIPVMRALTNAFNGIGEFASNHGPAIESMAKGLAIAGAALTTGGAVAILAALGPAGWITVGLVAGITGLAMALPKIATGINSAIDTAISSISAAAGKIAQAIIDFGNRILNAAGLGGGGGTGNHMLKQRGHAGMLHGLKSAPYSSPINYWSPPGRDSSPVIIHTNLVMDGRKMASAITHHQVRGANGPLQGSTYVDQTRGNGGNDARTAI